MTAAMQAMPSTMQKTMYAHKAQQQARMLKMVAAAQKQDYKAMDSLGKQNDALGKRRRRT